MTHDTTDRIVPQDTSDALVRVMEKDPAQRFLSYDDFIMALTASIKVK